MNDMKKKDMNYPQDKKNGMEDEDKNIPQGQKGGKSQNGKDLENLSEEDANSITEIEE